MQRKKEILFILHVLTFLYTFLQHYGFVIYKYQKRYHKNLRIMNWK